MNIKKLISEKIKLDGVDSTTVFDALTIPPNPQMGDLALPCFGFAKVMHCAPNTIAQNLAQTLDTDEMIDHTDVVNGYLNIYLNKTALVCAIVDELRKKKVLSTNTTGKGKKFCIDFSSVNIAKEPHIGHFASTVIGASIARLYEASGFDVIRMNYLGDYGSQFAKLVHGYQVWGNEQEIKQGGVGALQKLYIRANEECLSNPQFLNECRDTFRLMEDKDPEIMRLYEWFKSISIDESKHVLFEPLGITFDDWRGESFYAQFTDNVLNELEQKGVSKQSQGATIVDLEPYNLGVALVRQTNGTTLYCTRDISAVLHRHAEYNFDKCIYITGQEQEFYFKQLFKIIQLMGYPWASNLVHVINGRLRVPEGRLSSRLGSVALAKDIMAEAIQKSSELMQERTGEPANPELSKQIGLGALIFSVLKSDISKDRVFVTSEALNFDGETAPYIMYTHARCCSILSKAKMGCKCDYADVTQSGWEVIKALNDYNDTVLLAQQKNDPSFVSKYLINLATLFNKFYHDTKIIDEDASKTNAKLRLVELVKRTLAEGLGLLGISAPQKM